MKKLILPVAAFSMLLLTSCGGTTVCGCADMGVEMMKEVMAANDDQTKLKEIEEKYKDESKACEKLYENKSDEERKKMQEELEKCDSFKEMQKSME